MRNEPTREDGSTEPTHEGIDVANSRLSRRRLVAAGASTWLTMSVAGCAGNGDDGGGGDDDDETTTSTTSTTVTNRTTQTSPTSTPTDGETEAPTPTPTPTPTPDSGGGGGGATTTCPSESLFPVGSPVGFLVGIFQTDSGEIIGPDHLEGVTVRFPNVDVPSQKLSWDGPHADHIDNQWGGKLPNTADLAPGDYSYDVVVDTGSGEEVVQTGQFTLVDADA